MNFIIYIQKNNNLIKKDYICMQAPANTGCLNKS